MTSPSLAAHAGAFALGIVGAEYLLGWLPRGMHSWSRFVRPPEGSPSLRRTGLRIADVSGVVYDPLRDRFRTSANDNLHRSRARE